MTCSVTAPTSSLTSAVWVCATRSTIFSAVAVRNPVDVTRRLYVPAGRYGSVYVPVLVVVVVVSTRVATLVATTVAPGTTEPAGSVIVPVSVPTGPWPSARPATKTRGKTNALKNRDIRLSPPAPEEYFTLKAEKQ